MPDNHIVIFSPDSSPAGEIVTSLTAGGFTVHAAAGLGETLDRISALSPDVCVCSAAHPSEEFLEVLRFVRERDADTRVVVSVREGSIEDAVRYMKAGAGDFLTVRNGGHARLVEAVLRAATNYRRHGHRNRELPESPGADGEAVLVGKSPALCEIRAAVSLTARSQTTVLITGESGTGKEVVARLLHRQSPRNGSPCVTVNCAALPRDVIENELFGHEKGAFTGALQKKAGCFEMADGGTILLDEIAEMSLDTQAKLLRAIETRKFRRLGGRHEIDVDVRVVASTNRDAAEAIKQGALREDLYYRLSVIELRLPPVRERREDIPLLVEYFFSYFARRYDKSPQRFTSQALEILKGYDWPGNVREIRNVVERAVVICPHEEIGDRYLPERVTARPAAKTHIRIPVGSSSQEAERMLILETLASAGYNKAKAARILGVSRKTLHNKLAGFQDSD